jgi:hypothetical protein
MYQGPKETWTLSGLPDEVHTIIVGDSNLRWVREVPMGWAVMGMAGAKLQHIQAAIGTLPHEPRGLTVIIQGGINHRGDTDRQAMRSKIMELIHLASNHPAIDKVSHLGISYSNTLGEAEKGTIDYINEQFRTLLGVNNCMHPLAPGLVKIRPKDPYGTHYSDDTVQTIFANIFTTYLLSDSNDSSTF